MTNTIKAFAYLFNIPENDLIMSVYFGQHLITDPGLTFLPRYKLLSDKEYLVQREKYEDDFKAVSGYETLRGLIAEFRKPDFVLPCTKMTKLAETLELPLFTLGQLIRNTAIVDSSGVIKQSQKQPDCQAIIYSNPGKTGRKVLSDYLSFHVDQLEVHDREQCISCDGQLYFDPSDWPEANKGQRPIDRLIDRVLGYSGGRHPAISEQYLPFINEQLSSLLPKEKEVLELRFGLNGQPGMMLTKVGALLSISGEKVKQLEQSALEKLRTPVIHRKLDVLLKYPTTDALRREAESKGYVPWPWEFIDAPHDAQNPFAEVCWFVLKLYLPMQKMNLKPLSELNVHEFVEIIRHIGVTTVESPVGEEKDLLFDMTIEECDFSVQTFNYLKKAHINTLGDLISKTENEITKILKPGSHCIEEIKHKLGLIGVSFLSDDCT